MPLFSRKPAPATPVEPDQWRPQQIPHGVRHMANAIVEPSWRGVRVLAWVTPQSCRFVDEDGVDCSAEFAEIGGELSRSLDAGRATLDGYLTVEPTQETVGLGDPGMQVPSGGQVIAQMLVGGKVLSRGDRADRADPVHHLDPDKPIAFVAVDLLQIDDAELLDVPLMERKRLLEGALKPTELIRVTPFVRSPVGSFEFTWRNLGFTELVYKSPNSRYLPGADNEDWSLAPIRIR